jgi:hypothetical protein
VINWTSLGVLSSKEKTTDPYIGPRPFRREIEDELRFFGRDYETDEIVSLIFAHKLVLVYAESGTGKTSIFNARIIPTLEDSGFEVLPLARIGSSTKTELNYIDTKSLPDVNPNFYIFNTLQSLKPEISQKLLINKSLSVFLNDYFPAVHGKKSARDTKPQVTKPQVLIFDQLEEIFNFYPDKWVKQQEEFFTECNEALEKNSLLRIVFVMREDYIAQLDPFLNILPERLRPRYRLERLGKDAALQAIKGPLKNIRKEYVTTSEEIEKEIQKLVKDLLKARIETIDGEVCEVEGEFVEPIQLQVVCQRWWRERKSQGYNKSNSTDLIIKLSQPQKSDVDLALSDFYDDVVTQAAIQTNVYEGDIRNWVEEKLITSAGTRGTVHIGQSTDIPHKKKNKDVSIKTVEELERRYLIRRERRSGAFWFELTHDRLIKPIKDSNKRWRDKWEKNIHRMRKIMSPLLILSALMSALVPILTSTIFNTHSGINAFYLTAIINIIILAVYSKYLPGMLKKQRYRRYIRNRLVELARTHTQT